ncbi:OprO/OprP family phosphate-selective porin [Pontibacter sp. E15-1]|uniref:porin n=1 Tax=Pontibacter sp. E15-1 TaxID=2919918 RepID=UPI001F4FCD68|nr:porin [Pontibacter sp. E15-1]MCJ8167475.1 OprO/OprP family phosphate-selective porin [Pontibacter sp. E15-1]
MNTKLKGAVLALFSLFILGTAEAQSINNSKLGKGLQFVAADSSFSLKFGTRFQMLYQGGINNSTNQLDDRFLIRRARLKFEGFAYSPKLEYKIELGLSNSDIGSDIPSMTNNADNIILDAVAKWNFSPGWELWVGQTKLPGNRERIISSQKMQFVDRSLLNSRFNIDRDAGLQLHHEHAFGNVIVREIGSISMGEGRDITVNNAGGYDYTAKVEVFPLGAFQSDGAYVGSDISREQTPKLAIAAAYDFNDNAARSRGQLGSFLSDERDLGTLFVDAMFKYRGFSAMAEYANSTAHSGGPVVSRTDAGKVNETFVTGNAFNIQGGYLFPTNWEVAGRYTTYNPAAVTSLSSQEQYTLGLSKYIVGHSLKVQSDVTLQDQPGRENSYQFRLQMEVAL